MSDKRIITYEAFQQAVYWLATGLKDRGDSYDAVVGIPRGGLVLATYLAHRLEVKKVLSTDQSLCEIMYGRAPRILLVDDISDSGETFKKVLYNKFRHYTGEIVTASLAMRWNTTFKPDAAAMRVYTDEWLVFPWEKE